MKISDKRWRDAQEFELAEWEVGDAVVGAEWEEANKKYKALFRSLEKKLNLNNSSKILDVGCGATCVSRLFKSGKHYGIEPLADKLKLKEQIKEVEIVSGMAEELPYPNTYFDLVICRNVIDHTYSPQTVLKEIRRVIKDEGYFIFACYVYNPFIAATRIVAERTVLRNVGHPHTYTMKSLERLAIKDFSVIGRKIIYEGKHPNDFGKVGEQLESLPIMHRMVLFLNRMLGFKWFVRELYFLAIPKKSE